MRRPEMGRGQERVLNTSSIRRLARVYIVRPTRRRPTLLRKIRARVRSALRPSGRSPSLDMVRRAIRALVNKQRVLRGEIRRTGRALVSGAYRALVRRRAGIRPLAERMSTQFEQASQPGASGERMLLFLQSLAYRGWRFPVRLGLHLVRRGLIYSVQPHLAASQHARATKAARQINILFRPYILARRAPEATTYFHVLLCARLFDRIAREFPRYERIGDFYIALYAGISHLYRLNTELAKAFLTHAVKLAPENDVGHRMLGRVHLAEGEYEAAAREFDASVALVPSTVMAHHNYAGRYDIHAYKPRKWELANAGRLLIYDNLTQLAEDLFLQGNTEDSLRFYQAALSFQPLLANEMNRQTLRSLRILEKHNRFDPSLPVRILSYEWVTQFGHIGLLDSYKKMAELGDYPKANYVLLAPPAKVSNSTYLSYWEPHFCIVRDRGLVAELFPLQRVIGDQFMARPSDGLLAEPWTQAAARAQVRWAEQDRRPLLQLTDAHRQQGQAKLGALGLPPDAWYVGLHVREGSFYGDGTGTISEHRSADIRDYFTAIEEITSRGGWVIRLGDRSMTPLPPMANVIDYAHRHEKSELMDVFLLATSRFIIGTTSGLSTAAMSFGTPMLLVNCISNDWQIWTEDVDFIVKQVYDFRNRRYLSLAETYRPPLQGQLINHSLLTRRGYAVHANSSVDIRAAVKYKLDTLLGDSPRAAENHPLMRRYRRALAHNPYMFGAAKPALPFLEAHPELLEAEEAPARDLDRRVASRA